jgi:hypothetical protein
MTGMGSNQPLQAAESPYGEAAENGRRSTAAVAFKIPDFSVALSY